MRIPKLNNLFRLQFEKAQGCHVLLYPEGMVKLNPSAAEILLRVDGKQNAEDIYNDLKKAFPDAPDDMQEDINAFLNHASEKNWIVYDD